MSSHTLYIKEFASTASLVLSRPHVQNVQHQLFSRETHNVNKIKKGQVNVQIMSWVSLPHVTSVSIIYDGFFKKNISSVKNYLSKKNQFFNN